MRRALALTLGAILFAGASTAGASDTTRTGIANKHREFRARGQVLVPLLPVTMLEWLRGCPNIPATQGVSGYVVEIPSRFATGRTRSRVTGTGVGPDFGFRQWFFSRGCMAGPCCSGASARVPENTGFIYVTRYYDAVTDFELVVSD